MLYHENLKNHFVGESMTIKSVIRSISEERLSTYKKPYLSSSECESLGLYLWNKRLCSLLLPPLQIIEVSLRNALNYGYIQYLIDKKVPETDIDLFWFKTAALDPNGSIESKRHIEHAERQIVKEGKELTPSNYIAKLPFGFWVSFCDTKFDINTKSNYLALWPNLRGYVFPNALNVNQNPMSINDIANELRNINTLRNRIAHHETIFNHKLHYSFESALNKVVKTYGRCIKVIKWINPSNLKLIALLENELKFAELCLKAEVDKYKELPSNLEMLDINNFDNWESQNLVEERLNGIVIVEKEHFNFIKDIKTNLTFFANKCALPNKKIIEVGCEVNFIPSAPKKEGMSPQASKVKFGHI